MSHWTNTLLCAILALIVTGCANKTAPVIQKERVEIPVPHVADAPDALMECGLKAPDFKFHPVDDSNGAKLRQHDWQKFREWLSSERQCIRAWRTWGGNVR